MENTRIPLSEAAKFLGVSVNYLQDVLQDRLNKRRYPEDTHSRLLSAFFFKETNNRWYIARSVLEKQVTHSNAVTLLRDPQRVAEIEKKLRWLL
jgi:dolichyl-phosphate-mannose--protein O-mannosyl transferase